MLRLVSPQQGTNEKTWHAQYMCTGIYHCEYIHPDVPSTCSAYDWPIKETIVYESDLDDDSNQCLFRTFVASIQKHVSIPLHNYGNGNRVKTLPPRPTPA
ncbi:hypothetical protein GcC1_049035 [Golovinomyces cichoracearum]|uniref:Uncharacterized protein n=1 Tax=Golovinomyces cichoracearum TaxID=62708 RepID=A0A420IX69_9PEZI|nr:hypothetical protein GcC1_049035 [Golovinomyces cichoracearum]